MTKVTPITAKVKKQKQVKSPAKYAQIIAAVAPVILDKLFSKNEE